MNSVNATRNLIKTELENAFKEANLSPYIFTTTLPTTPNGNDLLEKEAKSKADNGVVYIGRDIKYYNEASGDLYQFKDPYLILIYSNNKGSDEEINELYSVARDCLNKISELDSDFIQDVIGYKSGLYMAWIRIYIPTIYAGGE